MGSHQNSVLEARIMRMAGWPGCRLQTRTDATTVPAASSAPNICPHMTQSKGPNSGATGGGLPTPSGFLFSGDTGPCFSAVTGRKTNSAAAIAHQIRAFRDAVTRERTVALPSVGSSIRLVGFINSPRSLRVPCDARANLALGKTNACDSDNELYGLNLLAEDEAEYCVAS